MDIQKEALELHKEWAGKIEVTSRAPVKSQHDLSAAYTPGVAEPSKEIAKDKSKVYDYTRKGNLVAVVTDGTAVLGLGNMGAEASIPVMEGKAVLFKTFGDVDAFPICLNTTNVEDIVKTVKAISPTFGAINLEDISAPRCFEIEERLKEELDIPVFHDDQHGTAVVVLSGMINALRIVNKYFADLKVVISGAGASGIAVANLLLTMNVKSIILCDREGAIYQGREGLNPAKQKIAKVTNSNMEKGSLADVIKGADAFIGLSGPDIVTKDMIKSMTSDAIVFAMANPEPEISEEMALEAGARVVGTGRSDYPNQVNNVLAFPGIFRGTLDARASEINEEMKVAAAYAIASLITGDELKEDYIIPKAFDDRVGKSVAKAVYEAAVQSGVARL